MLPKCPLTIAAGWRVCLMQREELCFTCKCWQKSWYYIIIFCFGRLSWARVTTSALTQRAVAAEQINVSSLKRCETARRLFREGTTQQLWLIIRTLYNWTLWVATALPPLSYKIGWMSLKPYFQSVTMDYYRILWCLAYVLKHTICVDWCTQNVDRSTVFVDAFTVNI